MEDNILDLDLNEFLKDKVAKKMNSLEKELAKQRDKCSELYNKNRILENNINKLEKYNALPLFLVNRIRQVYKGIKRDVNDNDWHSKNSLAFNRYQYIKMIMKNVFSIDSFSFNEQVQGIKLPVYLSIAYYNNKEILIKLMELLNCDSEEISFVNGFIMPCDYSKDQVIKYIKSPHGCTNGMTHCISGFWLEANAGLTNLPHNLIQESTFIADKKVFEIVINTLQNRRDFDRSYYLYTIPKYNKHITDDQIKEMGRTLIKNYIKGSETEEFIKTNMNKFDKETTDFLYQYSSHDNHFKLFAWQNFPIEYQMKYLLDKDISEILKILNEYSCKWSDDDKADFISKWKAKPVK